MAQVSAIDEASRSIRTFNARRGRVSAAQQGVIDAHWAALGIDTESPDLVDRVAALPAGRIVVEFGSGTGDTALAYATAHPDRTVLAVDVHVPGLAALVRALAAGSVQNVRVVRGDGVHLLRTAIPPETLAGFVALFPDPWPKARHAKRRLWRPELTDLVISRLQPGASLHTATDVPAYAQQIGQVLGRHPALEPTDPAAPWRVPTHFERKAVDRGARISDFAYRRVA